MTINDATLELRSRESFWCRKPRCPSTADRCRSTWWTLPNRLRSDKTDPRNETSRSFRAADLIDGMNWCRNGTQPMKTVRTIDPQVLLKLLGRKKQTKLPKDNADHRWHVLLWLRPWLLVLAKKKYRQQLIHCPHVSSRNSIFTKSLVSLGNLIPSKWDVRRNGVRRRQRQTQSAKLVQITNVPLVSGYTKHNGFWRPTTRVNLGVKVEVLSQLDDLWIFKTVCWCLENELDRK